MVNLNTYGLKHYSLEELSKKVLSPFGAAMHQARASQNFWTSFTGYLNEFVVPCIISTNYFSDVERFKLLTRNPIQSFQDYMELLEFILELSNRGMIASVKALNDYGNREIGNAVSALFNTIFNFEGEDLESFMERQARMSTLVARVFPRAVRDIESEYGFHFERGDHPKVAETDRYALYRITPTEAGVETDEAAKPLLILPPIVIGADILSFLPAENRSYVHAFANRGVPTYVRILKNVHTTEAVQQMTPEDEVRDTKIFCEFLKDRHPRPVTLNGYCQGGYSALCMILTGELDGLVDALITVASSMDATRNSGISHFLKSLPSRFNDLEYVTKTLPNGNQVVDGKLLGWVYKLKSIEFESPMVAFYRDLMLLNPNVAPNKEVKISKTALALNYWLTKERCDLPLEIVRMGHKSLNHPISRDGTLPVKLFGRPLNLKRLPETGVRWLLCYGEKDDLVEKEAALAPLEHVAVEVTPFPKGHVAVAVTWSNPRTEYALDKRFGAEEYRGPVRFQLDIGEAPPA